MEELFDELDQQEMHLRRVSRRLDQLRGQLGQTEVRIGQQLQAGLETACDPAQWPGDPPPGWPDAAGVCVTRSRVQRHMIQQLAAEVEALGANRFQDDIRAELQHGLERMPFAMESHFHGGGPVAIPPDTITRDVLELLLNAQQEALLKVDLALDRVS